MKKQDLKNYNRLLREENEALREILQMAVLSLESDCRCGEIKLLQEENTEILKDLNDLQADWAADHINGKVEKVGGSQRDFIEDNIAVTFESEFEYWAFMEFCANAGLMWIKTGHPRRSRPSGFELKEHAVTYNGCSLEYGKPEFYQSKDWKIVPANEFLEV